MNPKDRFNAFRREYLAGELDEKDMLQEPYYQFMDWLEDAMRSGIDDPTAMALATADTSGYPSVRIVLLKDARPEGIVFFSNYESKKGKDLSVNPNASLLFFWGPLDRQIRITGRVEKTTDKESDEFFNSRPFTSRVSSIVSVQSSVVPDRNYLEKKFDKMASRGEDKIKRPEYWGGYIFIPDSYEFWQGRENRLNDRILYSLIEGVWEIRRLAP